MQMKNIPINLFVYYISCSCYILTIWHTFYFNIVLALVPSQLISTSAKFYETLFLITPFDWSSHFATAASISNNNSLGLVLQDVTQLFSIEYPITVFFVIMHYVFFDNLLRLIHLHIGTTSLIWAHPLLQVVLQKLVKTKCKSVYNYWRFIFFARNYFQLSHCDKLRTWSRWCT